jgi:hypothetical protein
MNPLNFVFVVIETIMGIVLLLVVVRLDVEIINIVI